MAKRRPNPYAPRPNPSARSNTSPASSNAPIRTFKDGVVRVSIWVNVNKTTGKEFYSAQAERSYKVGAEWKRSFSFTSAQILVVAELMRYAYAWIRAKEGNESVLDSGNAFEAFDNDTDEPANPFDEDDEEPVRKGNGQSQQNLLDEDGIPF